MSLDGEVGTLLRKIRTGKGLTQEVVCKENLSRSFLSKIENDKASPTFFTLQKITSKLDISLSELEYLNNRSDLKEKILEDFWKIKNNKDVDSLKKIITDCQGYEGNDQIIRDIQILSEVLLELPNLSSPTNESTCKNKLSPVWDRINLMNLWTLNELKLASCCLFYFPVETSLNIANRIQKELHKYLEYDNNDVQIFIIGQYINICTLLLGTGEKKVAYEINNEALKLSKKNCRFDYYYFCLVRSGMMIYDSATIIEGLDMLERMEQKDYIDTLNNEISNLM